MQHFSQIALRVCTLVLFIQHVLMFASPQKFNNSHLLETRNHFPSYGVCICYLSVYTNIFVCIQTYLCVYTNIFVCVYKHICVCTNVFVCVYKHICVYTNIFVCVYKHICVYTNILDKRHICYTPWTQTLRQHQI